ncbi:MAG: ABC transporter permease [Anaerolineae bacterium]|jgi:peptide/nickel transport system permease protein|nr:ABC transporter permease [Anaerolineae bacterium]
MKYLLSRLLWLPVVMWAVATLTFVVLRLVPGNAADAIFNLNLPIEQIEQFKAQWDLDKPITQQYLAFMGDLLRGDFGVSMSSAVPINRLLYERIPPTVELAVAAMIIATLIGVSAGVISAVTRNRALDFVVRSSSLLGMSVPWFWTAIVLIIVFAVQLRWLPVGGRIAGGMDYERITNFMLIDTLITGNWAALQSHLRHLILPALAIGLTSAGFIARLTRGAMLEVMSKDYVRAARAKGLHERAVVFKHGFRNALLPILTFLGLQFGALLGGAVITEMVFSWPGLGRLLLDGILRRDYPVVQATVIVVAFIYVIVNLAVDLAYHLVDPRLRNT